MGPQPALGRLHGGQESDRPRPRPLHPPRRASVSRPTAAAVGLVPPCSMAASSAKPPSSRRRERTSVDDRLRARSGGRSDHFPAEHRQEGLIEAALRAAGSLGVAAVAAAERPENVQHHLPAIAAGPGEDVAAAGQFPPAFAPASSETKSAAAAVPRRGRPGSRRPGRPTRRSTARAWPGPAARSRCSRRRWSRGGRRNRRPRPGRRPAMSPCRRRRSSGRPAAAAQPSQHQFGVVGHGTIVHQLFVQIHRVFGHSAGMIALVDGLLAAAAALGGQLGLLDHLPQGRRQRRRIARLEQQTAAGVGDHFGKGPVGGQHGRHAVGPGLEDRQALALAGRRWARRTRRAIAGRRSSRRGPTRPRTRTARPGRRRPGPPEGRPGRRGPAGPDIRPRGPATAATPHPRPAASRPQELVQPFLRADPREEADGDGGRSGRQRSTAGGRAPGGSIPAG